MRPIHLAVAGVFAAIVLTPALSGAQAHDHEREGGHDVEHAESRHLGDNHDHDHGDFPEFVDVFFTHHAYLERKLHPRFDSTLADAEDEFEESLEVAWEFHPRFAVELEGHLTQRNAEAGDGASGFGDMEVAPIVPLVVDGDRQLIVSARSGFVLPTGDEEDGLGIDGWGWEPGLLVWKGFGAEKRGAIQAELTYERLFLDEVPEDEEELVYNLAFSYWTESNFIPIVELNGVSSIGDQEEEEEHGDEHEGLAPAHGETAAGEETVIAGTVGFRYAFVNGQQWGAGVQIPLNEDEAFDVRLVVGGIIHLE